MNKYNPTGAEPIPGESPFAVNFAQLSWLGTGSKALKSRATRQTRSSSMRRTTGRTCRRGTRSNSTTTWLSRSKPARLTACASSSELIDFTVLPRRQMG